MAWHRHLQLCFALLYILPSFLLYPHFVDSNTYLNYILIDRWHGHVNCVPYHPLKEREKLPHFNLTNSWSAYRVRCCFPRYAISEPAGLLAGLRTGTVSAGPVSPSTTARQRRQCGAPGTVPAATKSANVSAIRCREVSVILIGSQSNILLI